MTIFSSLTSGLNSFFNIIFSQIMTLPPAASVSIISLLLTAIVTFAYKLLTNQTLLKEMKSQIKDYQNQTKNHKDNPEKVMEIQKQAMKLNMDYMKHSMKPMLYTFLPLILVFNWLRETFDSGKDILNFPFSIPLFGTGLGWLGVYIIVSIIASILIRRIFKIS